MKPITLNTFSLTPSLLQKIPKKLELFLFNYLLLYIIKQNKDKKQYKTRNTFIEYLYAFDNINSCSIVS